ncbi:MAG: hypothetical protein GEU26_06555 [Nitrososphaeraceae archaeon]|nr:hypothetical protein [Nitrososphaeraceae archaeon]
MVRSKDQHNVIPSNNMKSHISITIPERVIKKIDRDRGDINRSRYILRLLERAYDNLGAKKMHLHAMPEILADSQQTSHSKFDVKSTSKAQ